MRKFILALLIFLLWAVFALWFHQTQSNKFCGECATSHNTVNTTKEKKTKLTTDTNESVKTSYSITDFNGKSIYNFSKGFIINSKNSNVTIPQEIVGIKDSIFNYLNSHQDKELLVKTNYLASEINNETNWGVLRAEFLKNILVKSGINKDRIVTEVLVSDFKYDSNGNYNKAISLIFRDISKEHLKEIEEGIANKTLYSNFGQVEFKPDRTLQGYTFSLKNYLEKYPNKIISIVGHTDNVGSKKSNYNLGLKRAKQVKDYLVSEGINAKFIKAKSNGETTPINTNNSEEGRALNRRIQITIK